MIGKSHKSKLKKNKANSRIKTKLPKPSRLKLGYMGVLILACVGLIYTAVIIRGKNTTENQYAPVYRAQKQARSEKLDPSQTEQESVANQLLSLSTNDGLRTITIKETPNITEYVFDAELRGLTIFEEHVLSVQDNQETQLASFELIKLLPVEIYKDIDMSTNQLSIQASLLGLNETTNTVYGTIQLVSDDEQSYYSLTSIFGLELDNLTVEQIYLSNHAYVLPIQTNYNSYNNTILLESLNSKHDMKLEVFNLSDHSKQLLITYPSSRVDSEIFNQISLQEFFKPTSIQNSYQLHPYWINAHTLGYTDLFSRNKQNIRLETIN